MKKKTNKTALVAVLLFAAGSMAMRKIDQLDNFKGNWVLTQHIDLAGKMYGNAVPESIEMKGNEALFIIHKVDNANPNAPVYDTVSFNGTIRKQATSRGIKQISGRITQGGMGFTEDVIAYSAGDQTQPEYKLHDDYLLSPDGSTMTLTRTRSFRDTTQNYSAKGIYQRK